MIRHPRWIPLVLAALLVALPACDDSAAPTASTDAAHATSFSSTSIAGSKLHVEGMLETDGTESGRVTLSTRAPASKSGRLDRPSPALQSLPSSVSFDGNAMTYRTSAGAQRTIQLSDADAEMLKNALQARDVARRDNGRLGEEGTSRLADETVDALRARGLSVTRISDTRVRVTRPHPKGGADVTTLLDTESGRFQETLAQFQDADVIRVGEVERKDGTTAPRVERIE